MLQSAQLSVENPDLSTKWIGRINLVRILKKCWWNNMGLIAAPHLPFPKNNHDPANAWLRTQLLYAAGLQP